jgi:hypothetical protein
MRGESQLEVEVEKFEGYGGFPAFFPCRYHCCQLKEKTVVEWQNEEVLRY